MHFYRTMTDARLCRTAYDAHTRALQGGQTQNPYGRRNCCRMMRQVIVARIEAARAQDPAGTAYPIMDGALEEVDKALAIYKALPEI